ncbi:MAG: hypothetical protein FWC21_07285 [Treponema sp.]|nr:hypothetical protein [Treponema sp.]
MILYKKRCFYFPDFFRVYLVCITIFVLFLSGCASSANSKEIIKDIKEGNIHLVLNERTANFSLFYLTGQSYAPLFNSREHVASYTTVSINGRNHQLSGRIFKQSVQLIEGYPAYKFESADLSIYQMFTPVTTSGFNEANGIMITYILTNISQKDVNAGLRLLLDTELGESRRGIPFHLESYEVSGETRIEGNSGQKFWISQNENASLMGSVINPFDNTARVPDYVHFASWNRFNRASWSFRYSAGRSLSNDSAVCYFYEPEVLKSGESSIFTIFLTARDIQWYNVEHPRSIDAHQSVVEHLIETEIESHHIENPRGVTAIEAPSVSPRNNQNDNEDTDVEVLLMLQSLLHQFISGEIDLNEQDLLEIENAMNRHR